MAVRSEELINGTRMPSPTPAARQSGYQRTAVIAVISAALVFFLAVWALDGYATARVVTGLGRAYRIAWIGWPVGLAVHILISLFQQHGWKVRAMFRALSTRYPALAEFLPWVVASLWVLTIFFGVVNVLATSMLFLAWFHAASLISVAACVILALLVSIVAEPVIVGLILTLIHLRRRG